MKTIQKSCLILLISLLLTSCIPETGDSNLAGSWTCHETSEIFMKSTKGTSVYQVTFEQDAVSTDHYQISNFYKLGSGVKVSIVISGYSVTLLNQMVDGFTFEGSGTINETYDLITMTYTADDGGGEVDHVTAEYSR